MINLEAEIAAELDRQDAQWGPDHDDRHERVEWVANPELIPRFMELARNEALDQELSHGIIHAEKFERHMIAIAALAIAAVKSSRRNRAPHGCIDTKPA